MPAACSLSGRLSTRKASTTISWVEDMVATNSAPSATNRGDLAGSVRASSRIAAMSSNCENTSQPPCDTCTLPPGPNYFEYAGVPEEADE